MNTASVQTASVQTTIAPRTNDSRPISLIRKRHAELKRRGIAVRAFEVTTPDGLLHVIGDGSPAFNLRLANAAGLAAMASFDELAIAEAFMNGDLDIEGEMLQSLR